MDWKELFNYGVPTAILFVVLIAIWRAITWAKSTVVEPVVKSHLELIETLKDHIPKQTDAIKLQSEEINDLTKATNKQTEVLEKRTDLFTEIKTDIEKLADEVKKKRPNHQ